MIAAAGWSHFLIFAIVCACVLMAANPFVCLFVQCYQWHIDSCYTVFTALVKPIRYDLCKRLQSVLDGGLQRLVGSGGFFFTS